MWSNAFQIGAEHYSIGAELLPRNGTDSIALLFTVRRNNDTPPYPTWTIAFRLSGQDAVSIKMGEVPTDWIWRQAYDIIQRSAEKDQLCDGEFLLSPSYLYTFTNATLYDLAAV
jgi:hypothetical protein